MINPNFYQPIKAVKIYFDGRVQHYLQRSRTVVLKKYPYVMKEGDDVYSLALRVFGETGMFFWTIIAECNNTKMPDQWRIGETIYLPEVILNDPEIRTLDYDAATSLTTSI